MRISVWDNFIFTSVYFSFQLFGYDLKAKYNSLLLNSRIASESWIPVSSSVNLKSSFVIIGISRILHNWLYSVWLSGILDITHSLPPKWSFKILFPPDHFKAIRFFNGTHFLAPQYHSDSSLNLSIQPWLLQISIRSDGVSTNHEYTFSLYAIGFFFRYSKQSSNDKRPLRPII